MEPSQLSSLTVEQQRELLAKLLRQQAAGTKRFPMSAGQQGLWHAFRRSPQLTAFNVFLPTRIRDPFQPESLRKSINFIAQRHAALRTTFTDEGGQLMQVVHDRLDPAFTCTEMLGATDEAVRQRVMLETLVPFELTKDPLLRVSVYKLSDNDWVILALTHHIIVDFWSLVLILSELRQAYPQFASGQTPSLPSPVDNYRQFVQDQANLLSSAAGSRLADFWKQNLESVPPVLELPLDRPRPGAFTHRADCVPIQLGPDLSRRVGAIASQCRATPFAVMHSAMQVLLNRYSGQEEFFVGSPFAGRLHQKYEQTVGFFINMLPVKATIRPDQTFAQLVQQTTNRLVDTLEHEAFPIAEIVRRGSIGRDPSRSPLFQVSCTFERAQKQEELGRASFLFPDQKVVFQFGGLHQESFYIPHPTCHYDLEFVFEHGANGLYALLIFCRDLFSVESMRAMASNFSALVDCLLDNPSQPLNQLPWPQITHTPKTPIAKTNLVEVQAGTVHEQIVDCARRNPAAVAIQSSTKQVSYQHLVTCAESLARVLLARNLRAEQLIPIACREGANAFIGMLAAQLAGAVPVPIDLTQPSIELPKLIAETGAPCVLTDQLAELSRWVNASCILPIEEHLTSAQSSAVNFDWPRIKPTQLAYMIYTSGSTGTPKGVMIEHQSICNTLNWRKRALPLDSRDRVLMLLSHQFDAALGIGWSCLTQGGTLVWPDEQSKRDPAQLIAQLKSDAVTILPAVPSMLRVLCANPLLSQCERLRSVWTGGESIPSDLPEQIRTQTQATIWNLYGPTETSVEATAIDISHHSSSEVMTIGFPIDGTEVVAVDHNHNLVPVTVPGQLAIGGIGLARGYYNDEKLTTEKFIVDPRDPTQRLYLTGDQGRILPDGRVEFLGRNDHQVKLRGYRIELGEIEATIQSAPEVDRAAVVVGGLGTPAAQLIAYISSSSSTSIDIETLRTYLAHRLAPYKLPAAIVQLAEMPLTSSGKVDRKRLPRHIPEHSWLKNMVPPRNELEQFLASAWCEELKLPAIGIHQNFFEVGGSSLQAAMLTTQLSKELKIHVPTALLFDLADIAQLAERLAVLHPQVLAARFGRKCIDFYEHTEQANDGSPHPLLAPLKPTGDQTPIFMVHPPGGIVVCYRELARYMPSSQPLWAIRSRGLHGVEQLPESIQQMAADYLQALQTVQPSGPYKIGGWSLGGLVAYEMAQQLLASGQEVDRLIFLDTTIPEGATDCVPIEERVNVGLEYGIELTLDQLGDLSPEEQLPLLHDHADRLGILAAQSAPEVVERVLSDLQSLFHHHVKLSRDYRLKPINARLLLLRPEEVPFDLKVTEDRGWRHLSSRVDVKFVPGHHHSMVQAPHVKRLAEVVSQQLLVLT